MLAKFAVTNFRGFEKRIEWDLTNANDYEFNSFAIKNGIIKNGIIYGKNGVGKTSFGLAIFDIVNHMTQNWKKFDYYGNFAFAGEQDKPVSFEYTFDFDGQIVQYQYSKNIRGLLTTEKLIVDSKQIFYRYDSKFEIDDAVFPMENGIKRNLAINANSVPIVNFLLTSYPLAEDNYLIRLQKFVDSMLWFRCLDVTEFIGLEKNTSMLDEYIIQNNLVKDFSDFLEEISEQRFEFVPPNSGDRQLYCYIKGKPALFDLIISTGTKALQLLYFWLKHMDKTSFVFIDEFDAFYHFKLSRAVCRRLFKLDCQVFLSSHNTLLMTNDLLRPDCNFILSHNEIHTLHDSTPKELRQGHNIEKLYRGGTFDL